MLGYERTADFTTSKGEKLNGTLVNQYTAFEGGTRYIFECENGRQYRCIKNASGEYVEYVA